MTTHHLSKSLMNILQCYCRFWTTRPGPSVQWLLLRYDLNDLLPSYQRCNIYHLLTEIVLCLILDVNVETNWLTKWVMIFLTNEDSNGHPNSWPKRVSSPNPLKRRSKETNNNMVNRNINKELTYRYLYLIVPFWYASAAYQASLVEPWFVFWREAVEPKYPWRM